MLLGWVPRLRSGRRARQHRGPQGCMGMNDDYGKKINQALKAVRQMHADVSKLLVDADGTIGKGKIAVFSNATRDLTVGVQAKTWMAWFVYRYYAAPDATEAGMVDAVTVWFF